MFITGADNNRLQYPHGPLHTTEGEPQPQLSYGYQKNVAEVATELDRVSSARVYFDPFPPVTLLNYTVRPLQTPPFALTFGTMPSSGAHPRR